MLIYSEFRGSVVKRVLVVPAVLFKHKKEKMNNLEVSYDSSVRNGNVERHKIMN